MRPTPYAANAIVLEAEANMRAFGKEEIRRSGFETNLAREGSGTLGAGMNCLRVEKFPLILN
jgi:hypothetical protein